MFRPKPQPKKNDLLDQLEVHIEEYRRISKVLEREYDLIRKDVERLYSKGLKRAAKTAFAGLKDTERKLEATEIEIINLRRVKTQLEAQPERLPAVTIENVDGMLKASQQNIMRAQSMIQPILERVSITDDSILDSADAYMDETEDEFENFIAGMKASQPAAKEQVGDELDQFMTARAAPAKQAVRDVAYTLPSVPEGGAPAPEETEEEPEQKEEKKKEIKEDAA
ncbi:hypothetical protein JXL21_09960 [Candidatus Bathyarchaeota archaeon]|nr:hypothetical protein [Candidatus Bathyarchaeota archaeon]